MQGSEMTGDRSYKVGEKKTIPISLALEGEDMIADECTSLYYLSLNVLIGTRKQEVDGLFAEECYSTASTDMWQDESGNEMYDDHMKGCKKNTFLYIEDGKIAINLSQQNFTDLVQFHLKQETNPVHATIVLAYRDSNGHIIDGLESQFVLDIHGDDTQTPAEEDCTDATATLSSNAPPEYLSFGEYIEGETEISRQHIEVHNALITTLNEGYEHCKVKFRMQVYNCDKDGMGNEGWDDL
jgi:hypothetical protein